MSGIKGLNFNECALRTIKVLFNPLDWTQWATFKIDESNETKRSVDGTLLHCDRNKYSVADSLFETVKVPIINPKLTIDDYGIRWTHQTLEENWKLFLHSLPSAKVRYALCNFEYPIERFNVNSEPTMVEKTILIMWAPNEAKVKDRMAVAMHFLDVKKQIDKIGKVQLVFQANDLGDISYKTILAKIRKVCYLD